MIVPKPLSRKTAKAVEIILMVVVVVGAIIVAEDSEACPTFTPEQEDLLVKAHEYGKEYGYEYTLPAIVWKESFVGNFIVRINPKDGKHGSYGITHILLETAMYFESVDSSWMAKDYIVMRLMTDDEYALELAVIKLESIETTSWLTKWMRYNGNNPAYGDDILLRIESLRDCGVFDNSAIFNN